MRSLRPFALALALTAGPAAGGRADIVDRIVASVGRQLVTLSDVQEEYRTQCFLEGKEIGALDDVRVREIANRLVDQALLRQEMEGATFPRAAPQAVDAQLEPIRRRFSGPAAYRAALERYGLEEQSLRRRLQFQADVERFIDYRFRPRAQVTSEETERYYRQALLPELRKQRAREPGLEEVREKIAALLTERRINELLAAWIEALRGQADIHLR